MKPDLLRRLCTAVAVALMLTAGAVALRATDAADVPAEPYTTAALLPGGIADTNGNAGYLQGKDGTLAAVDLERGADLWKTNAVLTPLGVWGRRLVTAAAVKSRPDQIRLVVLDLAKDGAKRSESDAITVTGFRKGLHGSVLVRGYLDGDDLLLEWTAMWTTGSPLPNELREYSRGVTRVNLKSGKAVTLTERDKKSLRPPLKLGAKLEAALTGNPGQTTQFVNAGAWSPDPRRLIAGNRVGAIHRQQIKEEEKVILQTWDLRTGDDADTVILLQRPFGLRFKEALDGRYVAFERTPPQVKPGKQPDAEYWDVFGVAEKKRVGKALVDGNSLALGVSGNHAFVLQDELNRAERNQVLKAYDLRTAKLLWQRPTARSGQIVKLGE